MENCDLRVLGEVEARALQRRMGKWPQVISRADLQCTWAGTGRWRTRSFKCFENRKNVHLYQIWIVFPDKQGHTRRFDQRRNFRTRERGGKVAPGWFRRNGVKGSVKSRGKTTNCTRRFLVAGDGVGEKHQLTSGPNVMITCRVAKGQCTLNTAKDFGNRREGWRGGKNFLGEGKTAGRLALSFLPRGREAGKCCCFIWVWLEMVLRKGKEPSRRGAKTAGLCYFFKRWRFCNPFRKSRARGREIKIKVGHSFGGPGRMPSGSTLVYYRGKIMPRITAL